MVLSAKGEFHRRGGAKPPRQNSAGWPGLVALSHKGRAEMERGEWESETERTVCPA